MSDEIDRGDEIEKVEVAEAPEVVEPTDEEKEVEALAEEKPRDESGKFTKKSADDGRIPKDRFDEAVGKERAAREAAEARARELESRVVQEQRSEVVDKMEADIEKLESQHSKLLLDGEADKAAAVMKQIRQAERQIAKYEGDEKLANATSMAVEQVRIEAAIAKLEADYPAFNTESAQFDQDLVDIVLAEQARLMRQQGFAPSKALSTAAAKIMSKFAPAAADKEGAKGLSAAKGADRKAEQVAKNLDTAKRQPGSMRDSGKDSDKGGEAVPDVNGMTPSEFSALPESTKAKLRGDFL